MGAAGNGREGGKLACRAKKINHDGLYRKDVPMPLVDYKVCRHKSRFCRKFHV